METRMTVPHPPALNPSRLKDPALTVRASGDAGPVLVHYDPAGQCGAVLHLLGEVWSIWGPLPFAEFVASLGERGIRIADGEDLVRWVTACSASPSGTAH